MEKQGSPLFLAQQIKEIFKPAEQSFYLINFLKFQGILGGNTNVRGTTGTGKEDIGKVCGHEFDS